MSRSKGWGKAQREQLEHLGEGWGEDGGCHLLALPAPMDRSRKGLALRCLLAITILLKNNLFCVEKAGGRGLGGVPKSPTGRPAPQIVRAGEALQQKCSGCRGARDFLPFFQAGFPCLASTERLPASLLCVTWEFLLGWWWGHGGGQLWGAWSAARWGATPPPRAAWLSQIHPGLQRSTMFVSASPRVLRAQDLSQASFWQTCLSGCYIASGQGLVSVVLVPVYTALAAFGTGEECHFIPGLPRELITV